MILEVEEILKKGHGVNERNIIKEAFNTQAAYKNWQQSKNYLLNYSQLKASG